MSKLIYLLLFLVFGAFLASCSRSSDNARNQDLSPRIIAIHPVSGPVLSMDTITGTNFSSTAVSDSVFFNGSLATIVSATSTELIVRVPVGATTGDVSVRVNSQSATGPIFTITVPPNMPTITSLMPSVGKVGDEVTITGTNFSPIATTNEVTFNGTAADVISASATELKVVVPISATTGKIFVVINNLTAVSDPVFTVLNPMVTTLYGDMTAGTVDGPSSIARFNNPEGIALDSSGNLYVADQYGNCVRKITPAGMVSTMAIFGGLSWPMGLGVDATGYVYVADQYFNSIYKISPSGTASLLTGIGPSGGYLDDTIPHGIFNTPTDLTLDQAGNIFVADNRNNRIRKIDRAGIVSTFAGSDTALTYDGIGVLSTFTFPRGIATDKSGNIFVAEYSKIRKITPAGVVTTICGNGGGFQDGPIATAEFLLPKGITVDGKGNIFVADRTRIREITTNGLVITVAGTGEFGFADGIGSQAKFDMADGIVVDGAGNLYVADSGNNRIRKISFH